MVQPMVPKRRSSNLAKKSMKFREALCVSLIRPNNESYDGGCGCDENPFAEESGAVSRDEELRLECLVKTSDKVSVEVGES